MEFVVSHRQSKCIAIDEQPNDEIVEFNGARKTDRLSHQPLDPGPQHQMFAPDLLRMPFVRAVLCGIEMPGVCTPMIGMLAPNTKGASKAFNCIKTLSIYQT